jgi:hypothetical protein
MEKPVQDSSLPNKWLAEGSAEYFTNVFHPETKPDRMTRYFPRLQLFARSKQVQVMEPVIFAAPFQHLYPGQRDQQLGSGAKRQRSLWVKGGAAKAFDGQLHCERVFEPEEN